MEEREVKPFYFKRFSYDENFKAEIDKFIENIKKDPNFKEENKKLDKNRFSRAIRELIKGYNQAVEEGGF